MDEWAAKSRRSRTSVEQVADSLRAAVVSGRLEPGAPLGEVDLAAGLAASPNTVREALGLLAAEGLAVYQPNKGFTVRRLSAPEVRDIFRARTVLETAAAATFDPGDDRVRSQMSDAIAALEHHASHKDWLSSVEADLDFHQVLVATLGSARLNAFFGTLVAELRLALSLADKQAEDLGLLVTDQRQLFDLLVARRRDDCVHHLRRHLDDAERFLIGWLQSAEGG